MASRKRDRRQALDEAFLRYGGEADQLTSLLQSIKGDTKSQVRQAKRGAKMLESSARQAAPEVAKHYDTAAAAASLHDAMVKGDLSKLGPAAAGFQAAQAFESGGNSRLSESRADALNELVGRATGAKAQGVAEARAIRQGGKADEQKVLDQLLSNQEQAGTYASSRYGELRGVAVTNRREQKKADETARHNRASEDISRGVDPVTGKPLKKPGKGKTKWASPDEQNKAQDSIAAAIKQAKKMKAAGRSRSEIGDLLVTGRESQTIKDDNGNSVKIPKIPSYSEIYASAALDLVYGKRITRNNVQKLHKRGIKVNALGYPTTAGSKTEAKIRAGVVAGPPAP